MTDISDLYEPNDRESGEPEQEPPLDLAEVEDAYKVVFPRVIDLGRSGERLADAIPKVLAELREARERIAEFEALEKREEWAVTARREVAPSKTMPMIRRTAESAESAAKVSGGVLWVRRLTVGPWEPVDSAAPF